MFSTCTSSSITDFAPAQQAAISVAVSNDLVINIFCYIKPSGFSICSNSPSLISRTAIEIIFNKSKSPLSIESNPFDNNSHQILFFPKRIDRENPFCDYCRLLHHHEPKLRYELAQSHKPHDSFVHDSRRNHFSR
jgi:hypothetical protein